MFLIFQRSKNDVAMCVLFFYNLDISQWFRSETTRTQNYFLELQQFQLQPQNSISCLVAVTVISVDIFEVSGPRPNFPQAPHKKQACRGFKVIPIVMRNRSRNLFVGFTLILYFTEFWMKILFFRATAFWYKFSRQAGTNMGKCMLLKF